MIIRHAEPGDWDWIVKEFEPLGGDQIVSLGILHKVVDQKALVAVLDGEKVGFVAYRTELPGVEVIGLRALEQWQGIGTKLIAALEGVVRGLGGTSIFLCTTNDNLSAIRFYQKRGFRLKALHPDEFRNILEMKGFSPDMQVIGESGIIIRDELVLEKPI